MNLEIEDVYKLRGKLLRIKVKNGLMLTGLMDMMTDSYDTVLFEDSSQGLYEINLSQIVSFEEVGRQGHRFQHCDDRESFEGRHEVTDPLWDLGDASESLAQRREADDSLWDSGDDPVYS